LAAPCSKLPPPILNRQRDKPIPLGLPSDSVSVLNNRSATRFFFSISAHLPINLAVQQSEAPKLCMVCLSFKGLMVIEIFSLYIRSNSDKLNRPAVGRDITENGLLFIQRIKCYRNFLFISRTGGRPIFWFAADNSKKGRLHRQD